MSNEGDNLLARKIRGPKMRLAGFPAMDPLCQAFASIAATHARKELRPGIDVSVFGFEVVRHGEYLNNLRAPSAIYLLSFPDVGGTGLIKAHPRLLGKVLDIYLGGDGSFEESNFARELTGIDLSIYGQFVDMTAKAFDEAIREICGRSAVGVPHKTRFEEQPGMIRISPDRSEIFVIKLNFHVADDRRGAGLDFVVPVSTLEPLKKDLQSADRGNDSSHEMWSAHMLDQVVSMPIKVGGVVDLGQFSVGELSRLEQGQMLELPKNVIDRIELRVETNMGPRTLTHCKLGVADRRKALRLLGDPDPEFLKPIALLSKGH